ncbi:hypothetical protein N7462_002129, partial [Penicillium macrosclerotiorum]|uniref:uncharacterized protein n=1 Tax=Penicillium macrosclerotiorum TaxID=303699 RepID=UPI002547DE30
HELGIPFVCIASNKIIILWCAMRLGYRPCSSPSTRLNPARTPHAIPSTQKRPTGLPDEDQHLEPVRPVVVEKLNVMEKSPAKRADGIRNRTRAITRKADYRKGEQKGPKDLCSRSNTDYSISSHSGKSPVAASFDYRGTLEKLFPDTSPESLVDLSREKLLELMTTGGSPYVQHQSSPTMTTSMETHVSTMTMERPDLESLHSMPAEELDDGQAASTSSSIGHISDDVNALSLTTRHPTSYLGISSIQAALKVIAWLHPEFESYFARTLSQEQSNQSTNPMAQHQGTDQSRPSLTELQMLDAYFINFQPFTPLLDEDYIRTTYLTSLRKDKRWLALLNIVLALGSIAAAGADDNTHKVYFERSMSCLDLPTCLANPSLEIVQALGLIGGWYCHYVSQPNLGYSLMGNSIRMAVTLGLQREPYDSHQMLSPTKVANQEFRRRVWWSLSCLETWGLETLGRLSMDCFGPSITVHQPHLLDNEKYFEALPLIENVQFVKIASKIQQALATLPTLPHETILQMDTELLRWWDNLPPVMKDYDPCPEPLYAVRTVMRWKFYNQRMLLYRPMLLTYAMRRIPLMAIRAEERTAIIKCREIAELTIRDISMTTHLNQIVGWNAVWLIFQATMVPLISLSIGSIDDESGASFEACKSQVERAILTLARLRPYGHTAARSLEVVSRILEANMAHSGVHQSNTSDGGFGYQKPDGEPLNSNDTFARTSDWTASAFENYGSHSMWEYLSWDANDLWPEMSNISSQSAVTSFSNPAG